jgi:hypothetical protein
MSTKKIAGVITVCHRNRKKIEKSKIFTYFAAKTPKSHARTQKIKAKAAFRGPRN